ncbi:MAG: glycosyltransferase [Candidatus Omnitrophica bacterium]|nr:glycosyltransferase [Candidatus Omnitrophota bacterium]
MKKVLVISFNFPPDEIIASRRMWGLVKYLNNYGYYPLVLTKENSGVVSGIAKIIQTYFPGDIYDMILKKIVFLNPEKFRGKYADFQSSISGRRSLVDALTRFLKGIITYPDEKKTWYPFAWSAIEEIFRSEDIKAVISSSAPVITHILANRVKRKYKVPWIADLRDPWSQYHSYPYDNIRRCLDKGIERKTLQEADFMVTVTEPVAEKLSELHGGRDVKVIHNGFDPDEKQKVALSSKFSIIYTGNIHRGKQDAKLFLLAIKRLLDEKRIDAECLEINFYGPKRTWLQEEIDECGLSDIVIQKGVISRKEVIGKQCSSQVLLLFNWTVSEEPGVMTGKIFEYLNAGRPIIAIGGGKSVVTDILERTKTGVCAFNLESLVNILSDYYEEYLRLGAIAPDGIRGDIDKYSYVEMSRQFGALLDAVTD